VLIAARGAPQLSGMLSLQPGRLCSSGAYAWQDRQKQCAWAAPYDFPELCADLRPTRVAALSHAHNVTGAVQPRGALSGLIGAAADTERRMRGNCAPGCRTGRPVCGRSHASCRDSGSGAGAAEQAVCVWCAPALLLTDDTLCLTSGLAPSSRFV